MAPPPPPGSVIVPDWQESSEGKEYLASILRKSRRRVFGECPSGVGVAEKLGSRSLRPSAPQSRGPVEAPSPQASP